MAHPCIAPPHPATTVSGSVDLDLPFIAQIHPVKETQLYTAPIEINGTTPLTLTGVGLLTVNQDFE